MAFWGTLFAADCRALFDEGRYTEAAECYKRTRPATFESRLLTGLCYYADEQNDSACKYFRLAHPFRPSGFTAGDFYMGECAFLEGKYADCIPWYRSFLRGADANENLADRARARLKNAEFALSAAPAAALVLENLGPNVNSDGEDYNAWLSADDSLLVFNSHRKGAVGGYETGVMNASDFYWCRRGKNGWSLPEHPAEPINTADHEKEFCLAPDGKTVFFGRHPRKYANPYVCDIYQSEFVAGKWAPPVKLPPPINTPQSCDSWPSVSADGKTLYFCSNRKGGYGGYDVWKADKNADGTWTVKNAGPNVNSPGDEFDVFIHPDGNTLYFCSDHHAGLGGQDIFMSKRMENGRWGPPVNLGPPINTPYDDMDFFLNARGNRAYINSDRKGGYGKSDLYAFEMPTAHRPEAVVFVKGKVRERGGTALSDVRLTAVETSTDSVFVSTRTREGDFLIVLPAGKNYTLFFEKDGYLHKSEHLTLDKNEVSGQWREYELERPAPGAKLTLRAIFFEHDSHYLMSQSQAELEKVADVLKSYPGTVEIQGYTSSTGSAEYNLKLSRLRAEAVKNFLLSKGVPSAKMTTVGYGDKNPVASNDTFAGRALNRRIEILLK